MTIRSGGQSGVDRAALDVALEAGIGVTGWCPSGRRAEDGTIPDRYPLIETPSADYSERTRMNVLDADATIILTRGRLRGGTAYTAEVARSTGKPLQIVDLSSGDPGGLAAWIAESGFADLNIAGPRETEEPGIYGEARSFIKQVIERMG